MPQDPAGPLPRPRKERTENAARRRVQLIEAALRSIVRNGLPGTTLATVAREAGLSQGVAVFYFQTKEGLLAAALERHYERYEANWRAALAQAGTDPAARLAAMVRADFQPEVCSREAQIVWHAFWGEASARPLFNQIADRFDTHRSEALERAVAALLRDLGRDAGQARALAAGIEGLTDGLWLQIYLASGITDPAEAMAVARLFLVALFPERAAAFAVLGG
ncbi:MAG: TetR family transcriptional regulator C-terminal domain-containing protein [Rhodobacteraceae bacterium]|nr:TetR family transcriptional regulator C-terminal domain-containing protein [Paracoccaceae bacterium]